MTEMYKNRIFRCYGLLGAKNLSTILIPVGISVGKPGYLFSTQMTRTTKYIQDPKRKDQSTPTDNEKLQRPTNVRVPKVGVDGGPPQSSNTDNIKPSEYVASVTGRFETPTPNILSARVGGEAVDVSSVPRETTPSKEEVKTAKGRFILENFQRDFELELGELVNKISYEAIIEAVNRSDRIAVWYEKRSAEFSATITFPAWAVEKLTVEQLDSVRTDIRDIAGIKREKAVKEANLSKNVRSVRKMIDEVYETKLHSKSTLPDGKRNWLPYIFSYPAEKLPLSDIFRIVRYAADDAFKEKEAMTKGTDRGKDYVTPTQFERHVLGEFQKNMFSHYNEGKPMSEFFSVHHLDFPGIDKPVSDAVLSGISDFLESGTEAEEAIGLPGSETYRNRCSGRKKSNVSAR